MVLHTLRCIGFTGEDRVASAALLETDDVIASLQALADRALVSHEVGVFGGWGLTARGRATDDEWLTAELDDTGARDGVRQAYEAFVKLNPRLLDVCHDWQMQGVGGASFLNDHRDAAYDARVMDRLVEIDRSARPILGSLSARLWRFAAFRTRLTAALERVEAGDHAYFTDGVESYHSVWFQLHEDLLTTLGIERGTEDGSSAAR